MLTSFLCIYRTIICFFFLTEQTKGVCVSIHETFILKQQSPEALSKFRLPVQAKENGLRFRVGRSFSGCLVLTG